MDDHRLQPFAQRDLGLPAEMALGRDEVGLALFRFDEDVDVSTTCGIIESRAEQPDARLGAKDLASGAADDLDLWGNQAHGVGDSGAGLGVGVALTSALSCSISTLRASYSAIFCFRNRAVMRALASMPLGVRR